MPPENEEEVSDNSEATDTTVDNTEEKSLEDNLYTSQEDDKSTETDKKTSEEKVEAKADEKPEDDSKEKETVEDDDLLGVDVDDDDKKPEVDDSKKDETKEDETSDDKDKSKAPEDYKLQLKDDSLLGEDAIKEVEEYAKKNGLSQDAAENALQLKEDAVQEYQKFLDESAPQRAEEAVKHNRKEWQIAAKAKLGDAYNETVARGNTFLKAHATPGMKEIMKVSGIGNNIDFIQTMSNGAGPLMDDNPDMNVDGEVADVDLEDLLYTTMK